MKNSKRPTAFVLVSSNHGSMLVNRHDYRLVGNGGYGVGFQILNSSSFDQEEVDVALKLINSRRENYGDGVVCIDCGANIGVHTIEWAKYMFGWGEVISVEAQERIFYALAGNIVINNCFNARAVWAAVGDGDGEIQVPVPNYFTPSSFGSMEIKKTDRTEFIGQEIDYERSQKTRLMSVDSLELMRCDFIKIDIEGMEVEALRGAVNTIERCKPQLMIERIKSNEIDIINFLNKMSYKIFVFGINFLAIHVDDPLSDQMEVNAG